MISRLPPPGGPSPVGLRVTEFEAGARRVQAYVFYPAAVSGHLRPCNLPREAEAFAGAFAALGAPGNADLAKTGILSNTSVDVPLAGGLYPLLVFNHGGALDPLANLTLMEAAASHGYIAASLGHSGESAGLLWQDGSISQIAPDVIEALRLPEEALRHFALLQLAPDDASRHVHLEAFRAADTGFLKKLADHWAMDAIAFVDRLLSVDLGAGLETFAAAVDRGALAYAGMSLGGAAALAACHRDRRARAGINLDGNLWDFDLAEMPLPAPFLDLSADRTKLLAQFAALAGVDPSAGRLTFRSANDMYFSHAAKRGGLAPLRYEVVGTEHGDFTDRLLTDSLAEKDMVPPDCAILAINSLCIAFLDSVLGRSPQEAMEHFWTANRRFRPLA